MSGEPVFFEIGVDDPQRGKASQNRQPRFPPGRSAWWIG